LFIRFVSQYFLSLILHLSPRIYIPRQPRANPPLTFLSFLPISVLRYITLSVGRRVASTSTFVSNNPLGGFCVLLHISACFVSIGALFVFALIERILCSPRRISRTTCGSDNVVCCHADSSYAHISDNNFDLVPHNHFFVYYTDSECLSSENRYRISLTSVCRRNISKLAVVIKATQSTT
jgi:hypothetical protein